MSNQQQAKRLPSRNQKAKSDAIEVGSLVTVADRFFVNHALAKIELGIGQVSDFTETKPYVRVVFAYSENWKSYAVQGFIQGLLTDQEKTRAVIVIHPVYLDKLKLVRHVKK